MSQKDMSADVSAKQSVSVSADVLADQDVPVPEDVLAQQNVPLSENVLAKQDVPSAQDVLMKQDVPLPEHVLAKQNVPVPEDALMQQETTVLGGSVMGFDVKTSDDHKKRFEEYVRENMQLVYTVKEIEPSIDLRTITLNGLSAKLYQHAEEFHDSLMKVCIDKESIREVKSFYKAYATETDGCKSSENVPQSRFFTTEDTSVDYDVDDKECLMHHKDAPISLKSSATENQVPDEQMKTEAHMTIQSQVEIGKIKKWLEFPRNVVLKNRIDLLWIFFRTPYEVSSFRGPRKETLLHDALDTSTVNNEIIKQLLKHIPVDTPDYNENEITPLHKLLQKSDISEKAKYEIVKIFVRAGATLDNIGLFPLTACTCYTKFLQSSCLGCNDVFKDVYWMKVLDMVSKDFINERDGGEGKTALHYTIKWRPNYSSEIQSNCITLMHYVLKKGARADIVDNEGLSILHHAVHEQNEDMVRLAIQLGCPRNIKCKKGFNAIYYLCVSIGYTPEDDFYVKFLIILRTLLSLGIDINEKAIDGSTALHFSAVVMRRTACKILLEHDADPNVLDHLSRTALHYIAAKGYDFNVIPLLDEYGADINVQDIYGYTPLHYACMYGQSEAVLKLLKCGADPLLHCQVINIAPIHLASATGDLSNIDHLLLAGANVNARDMYEATPLHYASNIGEGVMKNGLIERGGDVNIADNMGRIPITVPSMMTKLRKVPVLYSVFSDDPTPFCTENDINMHFEQITQEIKSIGQPLDIAKELLAIPESMRVNFSDGENETIRDQINSFVRDIADCIGKLDERFKGALIPSGSVVNDCKSGWPDEFDFLIQLEFFEKHIEDYDSRGNGYVNLKTKSELRETILDFLTVGGYLSASKIHTYFKDLLIKAIYDVQTNCHGHRQLQMGFFLHDQRLDIHSEFLPLSVVWRGGAYRGMEISVDINPVMIHKGKMNDIRSTSLLPQDTENKLYIYPKSTLPFNISEHFEPLYCKLSSWNYSFVGIENQIFERLPEVIKDAFTLCKSLRNEPFYFETYISDDYTDGMSCIPSHELKQMLFYGVENIPPERREDNDMLVLLPYLVYKSLLSCYENKYVPSFFMMKNNVYSLYLQIGKRPEQVSFCRHILTMLEELGFSDQPHPAAEDSIC